MIKLRVYLDTSVFSAYEDSRLPERQTQTREVWRRLGQCDVGTSELARQELSQTSDPILRQRLLQLMGEFKVAPLSVEARELGVHYVRAGAFAPSDINDALHVSIAVLSRFDILLSWNFRHLVNRRRRAHIDQINTSLGLPEIEIVAPPEL